MKTSIVALAAIVSAVALGGVAHAQKGHPSSGAPNFTPDNPNGIVSAPNTSSAEAVVRERLRAEGLSGINSLQRSMDGTWSGRALKDNEEVAVSIDAAGNVRFQ